MAVILHLQGDKNLYIGWIYNVKSMHLFGESSFYWMVDLNTEWLTVEIS